ncbi:O-methyltransferase [bacterium]|nr:O-methyltransferase [bacterium]
MALLSQELDDYIVGQTRLCDPILTEMEERAERDGFPIIGPAVGPWLYFFTRLMKASHVFEMGSGYGYSTWFFAKAIKDNGGGTVTHTVWDENLSRDARVFLERAGLADQCDFQVSEAVLALSGASQGIDIIFCDIDKEMYPNALDVVESKLKPGGLFICDNLLWNGKVLEPTAEGDEATAGVKEITRMLRESPRWDFLVTPLRDGVGFARFNG